MQPTAESSNDYEDLARSLTELEPEGFHAFADTFGPRLRAWFIGCGLSIVDAEDLAESCITDIAMKVPTHYRRKPNANFARWVFVSARHALVDWLRAQPDMTMVSYEPWMEVGDEPDVDLDIDILQAVDEALERLPEVQRRIVELRDLGLRQDYEVVGNRLGIASGTARVYHHRALRRLRTLLEADSRITSLLQATTNCITSEGHD